MGGRFRRRGVRELTEVVEGGGVLGRGIGAGEVVGMGRGRIGLGVIRRVGVRRRGGIGVGVLRVGLGVDRRRDGGSLVRREVVGLVVAGGEDGVRVIRVMGVGVGVGVGMGVEIEGEGGGKHHDLLRTE